MTRQPDHMLLRAPLLQLWAALLVGVVALLDNKSGVELSFSIFYLIPVAAVSWWSGWRSGLAISIVSALAWLAADVPARDFAQPFIPIWNAFVRFGFFIVVAFGVSHIAASLRREQDLARTDSLTGLANARWFYDALGREIERMRRNGQPMALAYFDLDDFKRINDELGHPTGDNVLKAVARSLSSELRRSDVIARLGGDEFALLLPETSRSEAEIVLERTAGNLRDRIGSAEWRVTTSVGVVTYDAAPESMDQVVKQADDLMYRAKRAGKNRMLFESATRATD